MKEDQNSRPSWMKLNPQLEYFDPFEDIGIMEDDVVSHIRYGINICKQNLLFDKTLLCEAAIKSDLYPIPNVPSWIYGMINLRGNIIPVFRIDEFLTDSESGEKQRENEIVLVIGEGNNSVGLSIHELPVAVEIDEDNVNTIPPPEDTPEIFSGCVNAAYDIDDKIWLEVDINTVLYNINSQKQG